MGNCTNAGNSFSQWRSCAEKTYDREQRARARSPVPHTCAAISTALAAGSRWPASRRQGARAWADASITSSVADPKSPLSFRYRSTTSDSLSLCDLMAGSSEEMTACSPCTASHAAFMSHRVGAQRSASGSTCGDSSSSLRRSTSNRSLASSMTRFPGRQAPLDFSARSQRIAGQTTVAFAAPKIGESFGSLYRFIF